MSGAEEYTPFSYCKERLKSRIATYFSERKRRFPQEEIRTLKASSRLPSKEYGLPEEGVIKFSMPLINKWTKLGQCQIYYSGIEKLKRYQGYRHIITPHHINLFDSILLRPLLLQEAGIIPFTACASNPFTGGIGASLLKGNGVYLVKVDQFTNQDYLEAVNELMGAVADQGEWLLFYPEADRIYYERQRILRTGLMKGVSEKPCLFFPLSITYQVNNGSYLGKIGAVYLTFHDPIPLERTEDLGAVVERVAHSLQEGQVIFTHDLVALILLGPSGPTIPLEELQGKVERLEGRLASLTRVIYHSTPLTQVLADFNVELETPLDPESKTYRLLFGHRERILYLFRDCCTLPEVIKKEFTGPTLPCDEDLNELAQHSFQGLIELYRRILEQLTRAPSSLEGLLPITTPVITKAMLKNTLRWLCCHGVITVREGLYSLS